ncbi:MAG: type II toxin-antitoxin system VapC family toxin [bacterium]|nr:type II toxin-antitoxin system VapC family toxin [bacterium]
MNGHKSRVLVDSNIIIYLSKGLLKIEDILEGYDDFYISIITYMEVLGFQFSDEKEVGIIKKLLNYFKMVNINTEIAENVISFKQKKKIKLPDAIILATAAFMQCDLLTRNVKDFKAIAGDVKIVDPFDHSDPGIHKNE